MSRLGALSLFAMLGAGLDSGGPSYRPRPVPLPPETIPATPVVKGRKKLSRAARKARKAGRNG